MAKVRIQIPTDLVTKVRFASDRTCCVCEERGKAYHIHHIDENPSNNVFENLAVLCLECHNETHVKGGFGRQLTPDLVIKYRDEWIDRVRTRRNTADKLALKMQLGDQSPGEQVEEPDNSFLEPNELKKPPMDYINALPEVKAALLAQAQPRWSNPNTCEMARASYDYIDSLTGILVTLSNYYSTHQFGNQPPQEFFSEIISSRFKWHRAVEEPHGPGTGGTIISTIVPAKVMAEVEKMVEDMVMALVGYSTSFDWREWSKRWRGEN